MTADPSLDAAKDVVFREARSFNAWTDRPVSSETLHQLYDLMRWGPTSANGFPVRLVFASSDEAKQRLASAATDRNAAKILEAPVTAIVGYDTRFFEWLPELFPHNPAMPAMFEGNPALAEATAFRNSSLQGAYLIVAARLVGLDCGPMSGFDSAAVDRAFFLDGRVKTNFICSLGYGATRDQWARLPRPDFGRVCQIV